MRLSLLLLSIESKFSLTTFFISCQNSCSFTGFEQTEAFVQRCSVKTVFLKISQNSRENTLARVYLNFIKKETRAQVFSCEFCEISKKIFFAEHLRATASSLIRPCNPVLVFNAVLFLALSHFNFKMF